MTIPSCVDDCVRVRLDVGQMASEPRIATRHADDGQRVCLIVDSPNHHLSLSFRDLACAMSIQNAMREVVMRLQERKDDLAPI